MSHIQDLIRQLDDNTTKRVTIAALVDLGSGDVDELTREMLLPDNQSRKFQIAFILGKIGDPRAIPAIFEVAKGLPDRAGYYAVQALRRLRAVDQLIDLYQNSLGPRREMVVSELGHFKDQRTIDILRHALSDPNERVRSNAISGLFRLGAFATFSEVEPFFYDPSPSVRTSAFYVGIKFDYSQMIQWLKTELSFGDSSKRFSVLEWIRFKVSDSSLIPPILFCLSDQDPKVRFYATYGLSFYRNLEILPNLRTALNDEYWEVRRHAASNLGRLGDPEALNGLFERINDPSKYVRSSIVEAIGKIRDSQGIHYLQKQLIVETEEDVREQIIHALTDIGTKEAIDIVLQGPSVSRDRRYFVAIDLAKKGAKQVLAEAQAVLASDDEKSRATIARTLGLIGDPDIVYMLVDALNDSSPNVFREAAEALAKISSSEAANAVQKILGNPIDPWLRINIYQAFANRKDPAILNEMIHSLQDNDEWVHDRAAESLGMLGEPKAVEPLLDLLRDPTKKRRYRAAQALGRLRASNTVPALVGALHEGNRTDSQLARHAAWALGEIRAVQAVPDLIQALHVAKINDDLMQIDPLCETLGKIADPRAVEELISVLENDFFIARERAAWALGKIQDPRAVLPLLARLDDSEKSVQFAAIFALGRINDPSASLALVSILDNEQNIGWNAALKSLSRYGHPAAVPILIKLLQHTSIQTSKLAGKALAKTGEAAIEALLDLIHSSDPVLRRQIVWILGEIGDIKAQEILSIALEDSDWRVRYKAVQGLGKIKNSAPIRNLERALKDPVPQVQVPARSILQKK